MAFSQVLAVEGLRCKPPWSAISRSALAFIYKSFGRVRLMIAELVLSARTKDAPCSIGSVRLPSELADDHPLQRSHRLEILRADLNLGDREVELGLDLQHQRNHIHRAQSDIDQ